MVNRNTIEPISQAASTSMMLLFYTILCMGLLMMILIIRMLLRMACRPPRIRAYSSWTIVINTEVIDRSPV
ncbi:Protein of unknown function [Pyronema omphalodes CBS 100304]|uniref:Uncharacterized protein n=1 Tax=Pyronema omphalodes (strain CBS 100304) TaxID=1076935 RepID=U4LQY6_PYROM|nr:Protein of unknown function [Pyronema omphalodes CBS 100304]